MITDVPLIEVTSTKADRFEALAEMQALDRSKATASSSSLPSRLYPFRGNSVEQVFQDFRTRLRASPESVSIEPFTYNTCVVVDAECLAERPWECIVCTDAVAFVDGEAHEDLKQLRMPLGQEVCTAMGTIEELIVAPNEVHDSEGQYYWPET